MKRSGCVYRTRPDLWHVHNSRNKYGDACTIHVLIVCTFVNRKIKYVDTYHIFCICNIDMCMLYMSRSHQLKENGRPVANARAASVAQELLPWVLAGLCNLLKIFTCSMGFDFRLWRHYKEFYLFESLRGSTLATVQGKKGESTSSLGTTSSLVSRLLRRNKNTTLSPFIT